MKALLAGITVLLASAAFTACPPQPISPPSPSPVADATVDMAAADASVADIAVEDAPSDASEGGVLDAGPSTLTCRQACSALAAVGCPHGDTLLCAAVFTRILMPGKINIPRTSQPMTCVDIAAVRSIKDATRLGFDCK
jgi:hypothetical protein